MDWFSYTLGVFTLPAIAVAWYFGGEWFTPNQYRECRCGQQVPADKKPGMPAVNAVRMKWHRMTVKDHSPKPLQDFPTQE